ncbi:hypothetical protein TNCV_4778001 [Trichonephila clavipes]|nr:hypothetical protein TNCV_4778001 [Trichonephila clavipes]
MFTVDLFKESRTICLKAHWCVTVPTQLSRAMDVFSADSFNTRGYYEASRSWRVTVHLIWHCPLLTTTPTEDLSDFDRFNVNCFYMVSSISGNRLELVTNPVKIRYLDNLATVATSRSWQSMG